jgi:hypothetical protein
MTYLQELEKQRKEYAKEGDKASDMFLRGMKEGYLKGQQDTVDKILKMISSINEFRLGCNCDWCILIHKITELQGENKMTYKDIVNDGERKSYNYGYKEGYLKGIKDTQDKWLVWLKRLKDKLTEQNLDCCIGKYDDHTIIYHINKIFGEKLTK